MAISSRVFRHSAKAIAALVFAMAGLTVLNAQDRDEETGLLMVNGWEQVKTTCTECHSAQLITQNAGSRNIWLARIRWMQDSQGLQLLEPALEETILAYLSEHYGPRAGSRRSALPPQLMPENPYPVAR